RRAKEAGHQPNREALDSGQLHQLATGCSPRSQESEVPAITLNRAERCQVSEAERDQRAGNGQHYVERLRIESITGRRVQGVGQVVYELHLSRKRAFDAVPGLIGAPKR